MKYRVSIHEGGFIDTSSKVFYCSKKAAEKAFLKSRVLKYTSLEGYNWMLANHAFNHRYFIDEVSDNGVANL